MSSGFKIALAIILLIALPGLYILIRGPSDDFEKQQAAIEAKMKNAHKKSSAAPAPAESDAATGATPVDPNTAAPMDTTPTEEAPAPASVETASPAAAPETTQ